MKKALLTADTELRDKAINKAVAEVSKYKDKIKNTQFMVVVDYVSPSYRKRLHVLEFMPDDREWQVIRSHHCAHGEGSSMQGNLAFCNKFSNMDNSHMSSLGAMVTDDTYHGKHGYSLRLNGLEPGINDRVRTRSIIIHAADYVTDEYILKNNRAGQSWGCPAVDPAIYKSLIQLIKEGCFFYAYYE